MKAILKIVLLLVTALPVYCQEKFHVDGAIQIANSTAATSVSGTIRWSGSDFEGWNGLFWVSLTGHATIGSVADIDGINYQTVRIGNQVWMAENLRVTRFRDGTVIDQITNAMGWQGSSIPAWCWYNNDNNYETPYGKLYNWLAASDSKGLCPTGWHVPTDMDWNILGDYLGGHLVAGGKMKETGTNHWNSPNTQATNESGFTGLPGGSRFFNGDFFGAADQTSWWSADFSSVRLSANSGGLASDDGISGAYGYSVRCIKN